jgi:putative hydrolase of the HAD superfamily
MKPDRNDTNPFASVRGVVFDVDGTLYSQTGLRRRMALRMLAEAAKHPKKIKADWKIVSAYRRAQEILRRSGKRTPGLAGEQVRMAADISGSGEDEVRRTVSFWMETVPLKIIPRCAPMDLPGMIQGLSRSGFKIGVFSDYPCEEKLKALGILGLVHAVLCSTDESVGAFKPHPAGFRAAAGRLALNPSEVLYVGDRVKVDAKGAGNSGMKCAIVRRGALQYMDGVMYGPIGKIIALLYDTAANR